MMERRSGRVAGAVLGTGLLVWTLAGCGLSWSGDDSGRLEDGIEELASVGGPDGQEATTVEVVGCSDDAEMPMGHASFEHEGPSDTDVDALNAEVEELSDWYEARWKQLGWTIDEEYPQVSKEFDGKRLRAGVDAVTSTQYSVYVVRDGAGLCS